MEQIKRGKGNYKKDFGIKELYKSFAKENNFDKKSDNVVERNYHITEKKFKSILFDYLNMAMEYIYDGKLLDLPCNNGTLSIRKMKSNVTVDKDGNTKIKFLPIDWKKTKEEGKLFYHLNEHTDGYKYFFHWEKSSYLKKNLKTVYKFYAMRFRNRKIKDLITNEKKDYFLR